MGGLVPWWLLQAWEKEVHTGSELAGPLSCMTANTVIFTAACVWKKLSVHMLLHTRAVPNNTFGALKLWWEVFKASTCVSVYG